MTCPHLRSQGLFGPYTCDITRRSVNSATANNVCNSWSYTDCADYKSGNGGCFITTAVCRYTGKPDDCEELTVLRKFRNDWIKTHENGKAEVDDYYRVAPPICDAIDATDSPREIYEDLYEEYIEPCVAAAKQGDDEACYLKYREMVTMLKAEYDIA